MMKSLTRSIPVLALLVLAGCDDNKCGPFTPCIDFDLPDEPRISDLRIQPLDPERANRNVRYVARMHYRDSNNDVTGGLCRVTTSVGESTVPVEAAEDVTFFTGAEAACRFSIVAPSPGQIACEIRLVDRAGHESNALSFVLGIQ